MKLVPSSVPVIGLVLLNCVTEDARLVPSEGAWSDPSLAPSEREPQLDPLLIHLKMHSQMLP